MQEYEKFKSVYSLPELSQETYFELAFIKLIFKDFAHENDLSELVKAWGKFTVHDAYIDACKLMELKKENKRLQSKIDATRKKITQNKKLEHNIEKAWGETWL
jgi:hypothetical protein